MSQPSAPTLGQQPIPADSTIRAGHARITFQQVRPGVYNITTQQGPMRVDEWSCSYGDPDIAVAELARTVAAFTEWRTDTALAAEYDRLTTAIHAAEQRHLSTGKLQTRREAVQPLTGAARDRDLAARILGTIHAAATVQSLPVDQRAVAWEAARDSYDATPARTCRKPPTAEAGADTPDVPCPSCSRPVAGESTVPARWRAEHPGWCDTCLTFAQL